MALESRLSAKKLSAAFGPRPSAGGGEPSIARSVVLYAVTSAAMIAAGAGVFVLVYGSGAERQAIVASAIVAFVVQLVAFAIARLMASANHGIAGWGLGAGICLLTLVLYGMLVRATTLPQSVALVSLATFLFITELIEPPLLNV
jgi:hypothetical protein